VPGALPPQLLKRQAEFCRLAVGCEGGFETGPGRGSDPPPKLLKPKGLKPPSAFGTMLEAGALAEKTQSRNDNAYFFILHSRHSVSRRRRGLPQSERQY
jgi:hypothetical protein